jgi:hypothetical protein
MKSTVAITVRVPNISLLKTVESIRATTLDPGTPIIVYADNFSSGHEFEKKLESLNVQALSNEGPGTQFLKYQKMIKMCETELIFLTQDDLVFEKLSFERTIELFRNDPEITCAFMEVLPMQATGFLESVFSVGARIANSVARSWNNGDNYLAANGRCICFRTEFIKQVTLPEKVLNSDGFFYFLNESLSGKMVLAKGAIVYNRSPKKYSEHLNQTGRYRTSRMELEKFFFDKIQNFYERYNIPKKYLLIGLLKSFVSHPLETCVYLGVSFIDAMKTRNIEQFLSPTWAADESTKLR